MATKRTQFRLSILGNTEDVPRMIRGYGRLVSGEVAIVLRPTERKALLVRLATPDEALVWEADGAADYLQAPDRVVPAAEAVKLAKAAQKPAPAKGSVTLRGTWTGMYVCSDGQPRIQLKRKLAAYGTLFLTSSPEGGWEWEFQRSGKWFANEGVVSGYGGDTLVEALQRAVLGAMEPVKEACSFRDTHRRREHDAEWAKAHPLKPKEKKTPKDPIERLKEPKPKPKKKRKKKPAKPAVEPKAAAKKKAKQPAAKPKKVTTKADKPVPAPKRRKAPKAKASTLHQLQAAITAAADEFARRRPEPVGRFSEIGNQDEIDAFDADNAQVQELAEQAISCASNEDMFRGRGETLKACFQPLADARRKASAHADRGRDNEFAAPFDLLRALMKEDGVAIPRAKKPAKKKPAKRPAKASNGKPARTNGKATKGNGKPSCAARAAADEPAADPDKDKALLDAFSQAIAQAVKGAA
jgi:hypothetical protein